MTRCISIPKFRPCHAFSVWWWLAETGLFWALSPPHLWIGLKRVRLRNQCIFPFDTQRWQLLEVSWLSNYWFCVPKTAIKAKKPVCTDRPYYTLDLSQECRQKYFNKTFVSISPFFRLCFKAFCTRGWLNNCINRGSYLRPQFASTLEIDELRERASRMPRVFVLASAFSLMFATISTSVGIESGKLVRSGVSYRRDNWITIRDDSFKKCDSGLYKCGKMLVISFTKYRQQLRCNRRQMLRFRRTLLFY